MSGSRTNGSFAMSDLSPAEREQRRLAALERWSKSDPFVHMAKVREGLIQKWRLEVVQEAQGTRLSQAEIARRIDCKRKAHPVTVSAKMLRLELLNVKADLERELGTCALNCNAATSRFTGSRASASHPDTGRTVSQRSSEARDGRSVGRILRGT